MSLKSRLRRLERRHGTAGELYLTTIIDYVEMVDGEAVRYIPVDGERMTVEEYRACRKKQRSEIET